MRRDEERIERIRGLEIGDWFREVNVFWGGEVSCPVWLDGAIIRGI